MRLFLHIESYITSEPITGFLSCDVPPGQKDSNLLTKSEYIFPRNELDKILSHSTAHIKRGESAGK